MIRADLGSSHLGCLSAASHIRFAQMEMVTKRWRQAYMDMDMGDVGRYEEM